MKGRAAFAVGLIDARPSGHQCDSTLVAAIGGCIVQGSSGEEEELEG